MARIKTEKDTTRKDVIVNAAAILFTEKGFTAASMRDLAERVGVEAASLYNHIRSKSELLHDICFNVANRYMEHMQSVETLEVSHIKKLETLLRFHIKEMVNHFEEVYVSDNEWRHLDDPYLSNFHSQRRIYRKRFAAIIEQGVQKGEINSNIDPSTAVLILLHAISGIESWHRSKQKVSAEELENNMLTIMIDGIKK